MKSRVLTIIGTRPEIIRLSRVMPKMDEAFDHLIIHTGQNYDYELNEIFFDDLEIRSPDYYLGTASENPSVYIGEMITKVDKLFSELEPDAVLILGDTNSTLSVIPAKKRKIPIFHMEAGNRCFDQRVPEEINRKIIDHISDINMPYSTIARDYLISEGIPANQVIKTGSPMMEILNHYSEKIQHSEIHSTLGVEPNDYFLISCHREENVDDDDKLEQLISLINYLGDELGKAVIFSTHPRTRKRIDDSKLELSKMAKLMKPLNFTDYVKLQIEAKTVFSDSGTITEESSILNLKALNIRESHERPEGMEEAAAMLTGLNLDTIKQGMKILEKQSDERFSKIVDDYDVSIVSDKVVRIILSHIDFVHRNVWKKY
jgi:UDP-N-acetylglucosamine 2-epimerase|tara:strand:+ start:28332 stop:29453 length:1122 start_codon:yes stop_codon:yes gene_type:complete